MADLGRIALALPDVDQGIACAGTALESRTYRVQKKAFHVLSSSQARVKLDASIPEARKLGFTVGANGWVTVPMDAPPPATVIKRWIAESHSLLSRPAAKNSKPKRAR